MTQDHIRVLMIEDNPGDFVLIREMLKTAANPSFELQHAPTFAKGIEYLSSQPVDVLLLDLGLPGRTGVETVAGVMKVAPKVPIIVLTGTDGPSTVLDCIKAGARDYFVKSRIDRGRFIEVLKQTAGRA